MTKLTNVTSIDQALRGFIEASQDLMTVVDVQGRFLFVSPAAQEVFGVDPEACAGMFAWDFIHPDDLDRTRTAFRDWLRGAHKDTFTFENRQVSRSGKVTFMLWTITRQKDAHGKLSCFVSSARDISALKRIELELTRSRVRYESVLAGMLDAVITIDPFGIIQDANESCEHVLGYSPGELTGQNIKVLLPEPYRSEHDGYLERYRRTGETNILGRTREFPVLRKDGTQIESELSVSRIDIPEEEHPLFCGSFRDITDRKTVEHALADSERRFRAIFDQEFQFVGLLRPDGVLLEANRASLDAVGAEREEVVGKSFWDTPWWSHSSKEQERLKRAVEQAAAGEFVRFETTLPRRKGGLLSVDFSLKPFRNEQGEIVLLLPEGRDITEFKRAQERETAMMRAFADIGESASVLAHEIKNPITSVNLALRAVAKHLGEDEREVLEELVERMKKMERLMRRTLSLTRPLEVSTQPSPVAELVDSALTLLAPHLEEAQVKVETRLAGCPNVAVDREVFEEVLTNLIRNSIDAIGSMGHVSIEAQPSGEGVRIRVEDDGPGIPEEILATVFKPFVTSKANGTGLGLAIARKIVEAHGGRIEVHNSPMGGARFDLHVPAAG